MPWTPRALMDIKREFLELALQEGTNRRELCRRFGISPKTAYTLLARHEQEGMAALMPRSRRPLHSPARSSPEVEKAVLDLRAQHPCWGGRKISRRLSEIGLSNVPPPSTVTSILHRHGLISSEATQAAQHWIRFEHDQPNALWQIDFKGDFATHQGKCYPLTLLDDHSRFNLALQACPDVRTSSVQPHLAAVFQRYGLPARINADNGAPWGSPSSPGQSLSELSIWLIRLGIHVSHSAPYHPQTNGKIERFHRSLNTEVLAGRSFTSLEQAQGAFTHWRGVYNHERPHDALNLQTPAKRYRTSPIPYPQTLPQIEYPTGDTVVTVSWGGQASFKGHKIKVSSSLFKLPIAFRADHEHDGAYDVFFCHQRFMRLELNRLTTPS
jgi:transposase InsO family protein